MVGAIRALDGPAVFKAALVGFPSKSLSSGCCRTFNPVLSKITGKCTRLWVVFGDRNPLRPGSGGPNRTDPRHSGTVSDNDIEASGSGLVFLAEDSARYKCRQTVRPWFFIVS